MKKRIPVEYTLSKQAFKYQEEENYYLCPWLKKLMYKGIDSQGYRLYKTSKKDCLNCPYKSQVHEFATPRPSSRSLPGTHQTDCP
ncbi:MAG: hypothetical protein MZU97_16630 [Bacillus subtilis]|nr:hypothetical protein [Bacillus subtilis]